MSIWRDFSFLFAPADRTRVGVLVLLMVISGLFEVVGIGLLFPYVLILQEPSRIAESRHLEALYRGLDFKSPGSFTIFLSVGLLVIFCIKGAFTLWMTHLQLRFVYGKQLQLSQDLFTRYLRQPYSFILQSNTSTLLANVTTSVNQTCSAVLQSILAMASELVLLAGVIAFLLYLSPLNSLIGLVFVAGLSFVFVRGVKPRVTRYGQEAERRWKAGLRTVNEGLSSVKELQVLGREQHFIDVLRGESNGFLRAFSRNSLLSQLPRVALETVAIGGMVLVAIIGILYGGSQQELFATLAVFAFAMVRLVPSANRILVAWQTFSFHRPSLELVVQALRSVTDGAVADRAKASEAVPRGKLSISIRSFEFQANPHFHLHDIEVAIEPGSAVAFIGHSGSGKTTLVDVVLGLFPEFEGKISVGGRDIRDCLPAWRRRVGYIPQSIYLSDDTIRHNIAYGIAHEHIDNASVERAVVLAGLERVIARQPRGLDTIVGDRGVRLSGGERQRIGIARALYHDPDLLILDEATSALDNETEREIVDSILALSPAKTIIVIAHRLNTVRRCDVVYLMKAGRVVDSGTLDQIETRHPEFVNASASEPV